MALAAAGAYERVERGPRSRRSFGAQRSRVAGRARPKGETETMAKGACIVVGVGPGLGVALAERFGREGRKVGLVARRAGELEGYRRALAERGVSAVAFEGDASDEASLRGAVGRAAAELGEVEVLVYNAAVMRQGKPSRLDVGSLVDDFRVNVAGALVATQAVLPALRARGGGTILFTGGGLALDPFPDFASLAVGKAGVRSLALSLAKELAPEGVHVATVTVCGFIKEGTPFAPSKVADVYAELAAEPQGSWRSEVVFRGATLVSFEEGSRGSGHNLGPLAGSPAKPRDGAMKAPGDQPFAFAAAALGGKQ